MDAAATERHSASAFTRRSTWGTAAPTKFHRPSTTAASGATPSPSMARWAASFCAGAMPSSSHSSRVATPTAHAEHQPATRSNSFSRSASVSILESRTPFTRRPRGRTAAPTISGPAHAPRPTSSTPTTTSWPAAHSSCSAERVGARFLVRRTGTGWNLPGRAAAGSDAGTRADRSGEVDAGLAGLDAAHHREAGRLRRSHQIGGDGGEKATRGLGVEAEGVERVRRLAQDVTDEVLAVALVAARPHAPLGRGQRTVVERQLVRLEHSAGARSLGHLPGVAGQAEPGHVGHRVHALSHRLERL